MSTRRRLLLVGLAALLGVGVTVSLGRWQLDRAAQKEALAASITQQGALVPLSAAQLATLGGAQTLALLHRPAKLTGTWLSQQTVFLDNRQMQARVGFFALTPLRLAGSDTVVMVQRGWLPRNFEDRAQLPALATPTGVVEVVGRIAPPPSKLYEPGAPASGAIRQNLDLDQFRAETGLPLRTDIMLQQTGAASEGLLRDWPAINLGVDKHYGYAAQWFALALLIVVLFAWFQIRPYFLK
jgi:surfeit locus 1 family protein